MIGSDQWFHVRGADKIVNAPEQMTPKADVLIDWHNGFMFGRTRISTLTPVLFISRGEGKWRGEKGQV